MTPAISYARVDLVQEQQSPRSSDTIDLTRSGNNIIGDNNDEVIDNAAITGVYANYSPVKSVSGMMVIAAPLDGCGSIEWPEGVPRVANVVFLARLNANSTCTAMEQNRNAKAAGAVGIVNMAPDPSSNYIWILQGTARDSSALPTHGNGDVLHLDPGAAGNHLIPHVAVSGVSGTRLYARLLEAPGVVYVTSQDEAAAPESGIMVMDLAITIVCITVAVLVLMYAYRVGRSICINEERWEDESVATTQPDPAAQARLRQRVSQILIQDLPVVKYDSNAAGGENGNGQEESNCSDGIDCAICLDELEKGDEVRKLTCDHVFHKDCIDPWLLDHHNCPLCKDDIMSPRKLTERMNSMDDIDSDYFVVDMGDGAFDPTAAGARGLIRETPPPRDRRQSPLVPHDLAAHQQREYYWQSLAGAPAVYEIDLQQQYLQDNTSGASRGMVELFSASPTPEVGARVLIDTPADGAAYQWDLSEHGSVSGVSAEVSSSSRSRQIEDYHCSEVDVVDVPRSLVPGCISTSTSPSGSMHSVRRQNNV